MARAIVSDWVLGDDPRADFLRMLATDLRSAGVVARMRGNRPAFRLEVRIPESNEWATLAAGRIRARQRLEAAVFIRGCQARGIDELFIDRGELDVHSVAPRIEIIRTQASFRIFSYCRFLQGVPNTRRIGRQIRALVWDEGQKSPTLMGVIGLASGMYSLRARDLLLGWDVREQAGIKEAGLRRLMDLAICEAVPPYNLLLGGKLVAMLSLSKPVMDEFEAKYQDPLLALVTTCATGLHCPMFHRLALRPGGLYRRIGQTSGYTLAPYGSRTLRAARAAVQGHDAQDSILATSSKPLVTLRRALRACGLTEEPLLRTSTPKGVYVGAATEAAIDALRSGDLVEPQPISVEEATGFWRTRFVPKRLAQGMAAVGGV